MKLALVAALTLAAIASAQTVPHAAAFPDPANLRGERVNPRTGRELPIDLPEAEGGQGLQQMLRRLNTRASLMLIVAHPDDEDGGMLTLLSRGLGARVCDLSLTRGEGGQNAVTADFEDALGLIRTQELLSADRYMGASQMFGTEVDFGFSKSKQEAFSKWTHQRVLYDAVRAVRLYRPLVLAAVFIGGVTDGHGQHQVSGEIAQEVFKAAADPNVFPELTREGILPWQPLKVYARVPTFAITSKGLFDYATNQYTPARFTNYVTGETTTTPPSVDVTIHEGELDPLLTDAGANPSDLPDPNANPNTELSYVQFARLGLGLQKTQIGPNVRLAPAGRFDVGYHLYGSVLKSQPEHETSFFEGIDTSLNGIATLAPSARGSIAAVLKADLGSLSLSIEQAQAAFSPRHPENTAPPLSRALDITNRLIASLDATNPTQLPATERANLLHELRVKRAQLNQVLADALGLQLKATSTSADLLTNTPVSVPTTLSIASGKAGVADESLADRTSLDVDSENSGSRKIAPLTPDLPQPQTLELGSWQTTTLTQPYFFRTNIEQPVYQLRNPALRNAPQTPPALTAWASVAYDGIQIRLGRVVTDGPQPVSFVPPFSLTLNTHAEVVPLPWHTVPLTTTLRVTTAAAHPATLPETIEADGLASDRLRSPVPGQARLAAPLPTSPKELTFVATVHAPGANIAEGFRAVGYPGIPYTNFYTPATDRIVPVDLKLPTHRRIGYLPGTGDAVPQALASVGLPVSQLTVSDLTPEHLAQFDTVILGVRTYNAHPDLHGAPTQALLDFARNGGNVVVQYQTGEFTAADAPFPLTLGYTAEKVVDETAAVDLLRPDAPLLSTPNRITETDFSGWIEERGHGFLRTWDPRYTALTETHDPGQAPQKGGLITTPLGKGHWTYCAFALYRQLPEAVPGSFRLFANLLGL